MTALALPADPAEYKFEGSAVRPAGYSSWHRLAFYNIGWDDTRNGLAKEICNMVQDKCVDAVGISEVYNLKDGSFHQERQNIMQHLLSSLNSSAERPASSSHAADNVSHAPPAWAGRSDGHYIFLWNSSKLFLKDYDSNGDTVPSLDLPSPRTSLYSASSSAGRPALSTSSVCAATTPQSIAPVSPSAERSASLEHDRVGDFGADANVDASRSAARPALSTSSACAASTPPSITPVSPSAERPASLEPVQFRDFSDVDAAPSLILPSPETPLYNAFLDKLSNTGDEDVMESLAEFGKRDDPYLLGLRIEHLLAVTNTQRSKQQRRSKQRLSKKIYACQKRQARGQWVADWLDKDWNNWYRLSHADQSLWADHNNGTILRQIAELKEQ